MGKSYGFTFIRNSRVDSSKLLFLEKYCPCCLLTPHRFVSTIFCCYQDANTNHQSRFLRISLIIQGCSMVLYAIWRRNHTSHKKFDFNECVANVLRDVIGIFIFDLRGHGGCQRPKTPLGGQKWHEGVNLLKKVFNESCSKTPQRVQSDLIYNLR